MHDAEQDGRWKVVREIPLAAIIVVGLQTFSGIWWAASMASRQDQLERALALITAKLELVDTARTGVDGRVIRLEEQNKQIYETLRRVESKLDGLRRADSGADGTNWQGGGR